MTEKIEVQPRYWLLLAVESIGALIILWRGGPAYRRIFFGGVSASGPPADLVLWMLAASALIQGGYWVNRALEPKLSFRSHVILGHIALFVGRLNFIIVSGLFATVFFLRFETVTFSALGLITFSIVSFSVFCYTRELERLGKGLGA
jgi:hypothetical protein